MDAERYTRIHELFTRARELDVSDREEWLDVHCDDAELRAEVGAMLALEDDGPFADSKVDAERERREREFDGPARADGWRPERVGPFDVVRVLGRGAMGIVFEAEQTAPNRRVALKVQHPLAAGDRARRRFEREAEILAQLRHPDIAHVYQVGVDDLGLGPQPWFAMELVDGVDLRTHADQAGLDVSARLELLARVADAVQHAHERGVVHRDLKPDNVLVDTDGRVKVLDFGVAHASGGDATTRLTKLTTANGVLMGTLSYMAPEQVDAQVGAVGPWSDVYALGVIGYELVSGRRPHDVAGLSLTQAIAAITGGDRTPLRRAVPGLPTDVDTIVGKALEIEVAERYPSAAALADDVRRHLAHRPLTARPPSALDRMRRFARRNRILVGGVVATFFALVVGLAFTLVFAGREQSARQMAEENQAQAEAEVVRSSGAVLTAVRAFAESGDVWTAAKLHAGIGEGSRTWAWEFMARALPVMSPPTPGIFAWIDDTRLYETHPYSSALHGDGGARPHARTEELDWNTLDVETRELSWIDQPTFRWGPGGFEPAPLADDAEPIMITRSRSSGAREADPIGWLDANHPDLRAGLHQLAWVDEAGGSHVRLLDLEFCRLLKDGEVLWSRPVLTEDPPDTYNPWTKLWADGDARWVIVQEYHGRMTVIDGRTGETHGTLEGMNSWVASDLDFVPGTSLVITSEGDRQPVLLDLERVEHRWFAGSPGRSPVTRGDVSPDGKWFAAAGYEDVVEIWSVVHDRLVARLQTPFEDFGIGVNFSPDGRWLRASSEDRGTVVFDLDEVQFLDPERASDEPPPVFVPGLGAVTPDTDPRAFTFEGHDHYVYYVAVSPCGRLVATLSTEEEAILVWDIDTGEILTRLARQRDRWPGNKKYCLFTFADDGRSFMATTPLLDSEEVVLVTWDLITGEVEHDSRGVDWESDGQSGWVGGIAERTERFAPGRLSGSMYRLSDGEILATHDTQTDVSSGQGWHYVEHRLSRFGLTVSPDETTLAMVHKRVVRISDVASGERRSDLFAESYGVAYSPDGTVLAAGGTDGHVRLFDAEHDVELLSFWAHDDYVFGLAWSTAGPRLVTTSGDGTVRVWDVRRPEVQRADLAARTARLDALRPLSDAELIDRWEAATDAAERGDVLRVLLERR